MRYVALSVLCVAGSALAGPDAFGRFDAWAAKYRAEPVVSMVTEGVVLAQARRSALTELMQRDPKRALARTVTAEGLPGSVVELLERAIDGRAELEVLCEYPNRTTRVVTLGNSRYTLIAFGEWLHVNSGQQRVRGFVLDGAAVLDDSAVAPRSELPSPWTVGAKRLLYVRVDFSDDVGEPIAIPSAQNVIGQVDQFMRANSFDKTRIVGTVVPMVLRMPRPKPCMGAATTPRAC